MSFSLSELRTRDDGRGLVDACIGWNIPPWRSALLDALDHLPNSDLKTSRVLEIGAGSKSALAPVFAALGAEAIATYWTDDVSPFLTKIESRYKIGGTLKAHQLNILECPYENEFDIVAAKSFLGGMSVIGEHAVDRSIANMVRALKPGGALISLDNAFGTPLHIAARNRFGAGGRGWTYFKVPELERLIASHAEIKSVSTHGFFALANFRHPLPNAIAAGMDKIVCGMLPAHSRVVCATVAVKRA